MTRHAGDGRHGPDEADPDDAALAAPPPRLVDEEAAAGALLRAAGRAYARGLDEKAGWARFAAATLAGTRPPRRVRWAARLVIPLALAAAAALAVAGRWRRATRRRGRSPHARPRPRPPAGPEGCGPLRGVSRPEPAGGPARGRGEPRRAPMRRPHALTAGATLLADGTSIRLAPRAVAAAARRARGPRGHDGRARPASSPEVRAVMRANHFQVTGGRYRFQVARAFPPGAATRAGAGGP